MFREHLFPAAELFLAPAKPPPPPPLPWTYPLLPPSLLSVPVSSPPPSGGLIPLLQRIFRRRRRRGERPIRFRVDRKSIAWDLVRKRKLLFRYFDKFVCNNINIICMYLVYIFVNTYIISSHICIAFM